jgi:hypothetical protein
MWIAMPHKFWDVGRFLQYGYRRVELLNRRQLTLVSAENICCGVKEREMSFWIVLL